MELQNLSLFPASGRVCGGHAVEKPKIAHARGQWNRAKTGGVERFMDYCLADGDGSATMWTAPLDTDVDGDGTLDGVGLDVDADGSVDDALADFDGDGIADHAVLDGTSYFTDDGTGTWAVSVDRGGQLRWFGLDGVEQFGGPMVDLDGDGQAGERLVDSNSDGLADRALGDGVAYADTDSDGMWDLRLTDSDGDGRADAANEL